MSLLTFIILCLKCIGYILVVGITAVVIVMIASATALFIAKFIKALKED